jgi:hypothetical protein
MFRKRAATGRRNRKSPPTAGLEKLESRHLMAGDVALPLISVTAPLQVTRTSEADFWVKLDRPVAAGQTLDVQYTTRGIGAAAARDFESLSATAHFVAGESAKLINVRTLPAATASSSPKPLTFALDITSASSGKVVQKTATTTIVNEVPGFQIDISFSGTVSDKTKVAAREAADRWQSIITGDLPSVVINGEFIDDFKLVVKEQAIDGASGILAYASPTRQYGTDPSQYIIQKRASGNTSYGGTAVVDLADRTNSQIKDILVHELGHALGIGPFWSLEYIRSSFKPLGLVTNLNTDQPLYIGANALAEYRKLAPGAVGVPLESGGGAGTRAAHWSESVLGDELMTGYLSDTMPLSRITVGALQDLGYSVNYAKADPYSLPTPKPPVAAASSTGLTARLATIAMAAGTGPDGTVTITVSGGNASAAASTPSTTVGPAAPRTNNAATTASAPTVTAAPAATSQQTVVNRSAPAAKPANVATLAPSKTIGFGAYGR